MGISYESQAIKYLNEKVFSVVMVASNPEVLRQIVRKTSQGEPAMSIVDVGICHGG
jgi:hypothetical protein